MQRLWRGLGFVSCLSQCFVGRVGSTRPCYAVIADANKPRRLGEGMSSVARCPF